MAQPGTNGHNGTNGHASANSLEEVIRALLVENFLVAIGGADLADDDSLIEQGIIDSTGVLELVMLLEETFDIRVQDADVLPENLDSVNNLVAYVQRKLQVAR